jgi:hypothetical protein
MVSAVDVTGVVTVVEFVVVDATVVLGAVAVRVVVLVIDVVTFEDVVVIVGWVQLTNAANNRTVASSADTHLTIRFFISLLHFCLFIRIKHCERLSCLFFKFRSFIGYFYAK